MNKKVLIISTSPRKNGNSETLSDAFLKAADGGKKKKKISLVGLFKHGNFRK